MEKSEVKSCVVENCGANSEQCPYLFFLKVPQNVDRRVLWCDAMGIPVRKGRFYCCTRHFDIPGDFDGDSAADKTSGVRLKLKSDVLPHKSIPYQNEVRNIYSIYNQMLRTGKVEKNYKNLLPAIEQDLHVKVPLNIKAEVLDKTYQFLIDEVTNYFSKHANSKSRYQLVQYLKSKRDRLAEIANENVVRGTLHATLPYRSIQPFLQYEATGSLDLPIDHKQLELLYFECEPNHIKVMVRPPKNEPPPNRGENTVDYDLFFTPGVSVNLVLPFLEVSRSVLSNSERYLVDSKSTLKPSELKPNGLEKFQKVDKPYRLKSAKVGQNVTLEYLDILVNLFETYEFMLSQRMRSTLIFLLKQIRQEFEEYEMTELNVTYAFYLSTFKYFRIINDDIKPSRTDQDDCLYIKEIVNPEVNFFLNTAIGNASNSIDKIEDYFRPILDYVNSENGSKDGEPYLKFSDTLKKAITYTCLECNNTFDSALAHLAIQEHLYCGVKKWRCVNCRTKFKQVDIASNKWRHECAMRK
uniref:THAP-type domain-containing protein n=1 Tax=Culex tarsalis TaxID=7177 RepID=A0A1Q3F086_CULTA